jgi:hypothetical protein
MSELIEKLNHAATGADGELSQLLRWAALHIAAQDEALAEARAELESEHDERIRMELAIQVAKAKMMEIVGAMDYSRPVNIQLAKDHAPHINIMARHGIEPYAKKPRKPKAENKS